MSELRVNLTKEKAHHQAVLDELNEAHQLGQNLKDELSRTEAQYAAAENRLTNVAQIQRGRFTIDTCIDAQYTYYISLRTNSPI